MKPFKAGQNREKIFQLFLYAERLRFSQILKKTKIPSNLLAYFLKKMFREKILVKEKNFYLLSNDAEKLIPFFVKDRQRISPLVVLLIACTKENKILLVKRAKSFKYCLCNNSNVVDYFGYTKDILRAFGVKAIIFP